SSLRQRSSTRSPSPSCNHTKRRKCDAAVRPGPSAFPFPDANPSQPEKENPDEIAQTPYLSSRYVHGSRRLLGSAIPLRPPASAVLARRTERDCHPSAD